MACRGACGYRTQTCLEVACILVQIACVVVHSCTQTAAVVVCMHVDDMCVLTCMVRVVGGGNRMVGKMHFLLMTARLSF